MKKITPLLLVFLVTICNSIQAQKIYKAQMNLAEYTARPSSIESPLKRQVHADFASLKQITTIDFTGAITKEAPAYKLSLQKFLRSENIFSITNAKAFAGVTKESPSALTIILPYKNRQVVIDVIASGIFTDDFKIYTDKNPKGTTPEGSAFYKGVVRGTNASASISLFNDHVEGFITLNQHTSIEITKLLGANPSSQHVIYDDADLLVKGTGHYCTLLYPPASQMEKQQHISDAENTTSQLKCVKNFWETAYSVYQQFGSEKKVSDFVTSLFNVYATIYTNEKIAMKLKSSFIWTSQDPYNDDLNTFSGTRTNFGANTAVLISNAATGGVAWLNTICQSGDYYRHAYCGSIARYETILPFTSYTWPVEVTTHEVGHNLGSRHTHACAWNGNNTAIDGCGPAAGYSEGCNGPLPKNGGTIMSYCHLVSGVGIDLTKGFGGQPGDLIRGIVKSCITTTCTSTGTTCDAPVNVAAGKIAGTTATVSWKRVTGAAYYYIYLSADGGSNYSLVADNLYGNSFNLSGLLNNHNYICEVWVACGNGNYNSTSINFTTTPSFVPPVSIIQRIAFSVQPNPVHGSRFTVSLAKGYENAFIEVINNNNQVIYQSHGSEGIRSFTAPQTKGLYFVRATLNGEIITEKILVE